MKFTRIMERTPSPECVATVRRDDGHEPVRYDGIRVDDEWKHWGILGGGGRCEPIGTCAFSFKVFTADNDVITIAQGHR